MSSNKYDRFPESSAFGESLGDKPSKQCRILFDLNDKHSQYKVLNQIKRAENQLFIISLFSLNGILSNKN